MAINLDLGFCKELIFNVFCSDRAKGFSGLARFQSEIELNLVDLASEFLGFV